MTSTVERTAAGAVITGFEYTYDDLSRIIEEKVLANSTKMCYTYDNLSRVTERTVKKLSDNSVVSTETFNYDAAGNVTSAPDSSFQYDTNNRLISFNGNAVSYDLDGNMLSNGSLTCTYDSANRLVSAGGYTYTYNAEDVRIRNLCSDEDTTYTYNTNCKLSQLLTKTTNGVVTKYVYGLGLIGEEASGAFKTYHFDFRGSTVAVTDASGTVTDTFAYDTYGKCIARTGTGDIIFGYNGRDGVVTDTNGLCYMRARYYSPDMRRFINADIIAGKISNAVTLNRYAYANGNPVSNVDPFGLSILDKVKNAYNVAKNFIVDKAQKSWGYIKKVGNKMLTEAKEIGGEILDGFKLTVKGVEMSFLGIDRFIVIPHESKNYENNLKKDITSGLIKNQNTSEMENLFLGKAPMSDVGCEVIAVYNAEYLLGIDDLSLVRVMRAAEENGALAFQSILNGAFGTNPYSLPRVLSAEGLNYSVVNSFDSIKDCEGVYIVSFWNSADLGSAVHTVAVEVDDKGNLHIYNNGKDVNSFTDDNIYITGYKISKK